MIFKIVYVFNRISIRYYLSYLWENYNDMLKGDLVREDSLLWFYILYDIL